MASPGSALAGSILYITNIESRPRPGSLNNGLKRPFRSPRSLLVGPPQIELRTTLSKIRSPNHFLKNISGFAILPTAYVVLGLLALSAFDTVCATDVGDATPPPCVRLHGSGLHLLCHFGIGETARALHHWLNHSASKFCLDNARFDHDYLVFDTTHFGVRRDLLILIDSPCFPNGYQLSLNGRFVCSTALSRCP